MNFDGDWGGGKSAGDWRFANFFPSRLEEGQALLYEASALGQQPADFTKIFSDWSIGIPSQSTRGTLGWAGKFGKLCRIVKENNFEFWE